MKRMELARKGQTLKALGHRYGAAPGVCPAQWIPEALASDTANDTDANAGACVQGGVVRGRSA